MGNCPASSTFHSDAGRLCDCNLTHSYSCDKKIPLTNSAMESLATFFFSFRRNGPQSNGHNNLSTGRTSHGQQASGVYGGYSEFLFWTRTVRLNDWTFEHRTKVRLLGRRFWHANANICVFSVLQDKATRWRNLPEPRQRMSRRAPGNSLRLEERWPE